MNDEVIINAGSSTLSFEDVTAVDFSGGAGTASAWSTALSGLGFITNGGAATFSNVVITVAATFNGDAAFAGHNISGVNELAGNGGFLSIAGNTTFSDTVTFSDTANLKNIEVSNTANMNDVNFADTATFNANTVFAGTSFTLNDTATNAVRAAAGGFTGSRTLSILTNYTFNITNGIIYSITP